MKLLLGGGGEGVGRRTTTTAVLVLLIGGLLDGCFALKCYKCYDNQDDSGPYTDCKDGGSPKSEKQPISETCKGTNPACAFQKAVHDGKVLKVAMGCVNILDMDCSNGKKLKMSGTCDKTSQKDRIENREKCHHHQTPVEVSDDWEVKKKEEGEVGSERSGNDTEGSSGGKVAARESVIPIPSADWDFCTCTTDMCNKNCKCSGGAGGGAEVSGILMIIATGTVWMMI